MQIHIHVSGGPSFTVEAPDGSSGHVRLSVPKLRGVKDQPMKWDEWLAMGAAITLVGFAGFSIGTTLAAYIYYIVGAL